MPSRTSTMYAVINRRGQLVCIMRTKRIVKTTAQQLTGKTWKRLQDEDGCEIQSVKVGIDLASEAKKAQGLLTPPGEAALWGQFARGQAWVTLPRSLMHEMPDDWKDRFAELLDEWDSEWDWPEWFPRSRVQAVGAGSRFTSWPAWLLEYKYRNREAIDQIRVKP